MVMVLGIEHFHKDNLRHLPRFPDFFVTFRILSPKDEPLAARSYFFISFGGRFILTITRHGILFIGWPGDEDENCLRIPVTIDGPGSFLSPTM